MEDDQNSTILIDNPSPHLDEFGFGGSGNGSDGFGDGIYDIAHFVQGHGSSGFGGGSWAIMHEILKSATIDDTHALKDKYNSGSLTVFSKPRIPLKTQTPLLSALTP